MVPEYLKTGNYSPQPSVATISNAMDVGDPSNFIRIQKLFDNDLAVLSRKLTSYSFTDEETREALKNIYQKTGYIADPHGAVGYLGLKKYMENHTDVYGIFLETAHPVKFWPVMKELINTEIKIPEQIQAVINQPKVSTKITDYSAFKRFLLDSALD